MESSVGGNKRKLDDDDIELAKQKVQAIAARFLVDSKRSRTSDPSPPPPPPPDYSSSFPVSYTPQINNNSGPTTKKISIPNAKVGVIIGRGGDMIKNLQARSEARIQITRDNDADPSSLTRDVELMGTPDQIARAEQLINDTIAEADAASSGPNGNRGSVPPVQPGAQQFVIKVPNDKVALVIGKQGETIKTMQNTTGARLQVVPLRLPPGDTSTERNVYISGTQEQIEAAKELVNEVISGNRLKVLSGISAYTQPAYASGAPPAQQPPPAYGYAQPGTYAMPPAPYYAGYPPQPAYGQPPPSSTPPNVGYNYSQMPAAAGYNYNQAYPQQPPNYNQAPDLSNPGYGPPPATSSQADGSAAVDVTAQSQSQSQPPANGYTAAYPTYSGAPPVPPAYSQAGYGQQQDGQVANQASYPYYGQTGYPPAQPSYYQGAYPAVPPPPVTNGVPHSSYGVEGTDGGYTSTVPVASAEENEKPQS